MTEIEQLTLINNEKIDANGETNKITAPTAPQAGCMHGKFKLERRIGIEVQDYLWLAVNGDEEVVLKFFAAGDKRYFVGEKFVGDKYFENELQVLKELTEEKTKYMVRIIEAFEPEKILALEYGSYNLRELMQARKPEPAERATIVKHILGALGELYLCKIVHTNLRPKNIMLFKNGETETWKLIDFEVARRLQEPITDIIVEDRDIDCRSPELVKGQPIETDYSMDMWSFGHILYYLETGAKYFKETQTRFEKIEALTSDKPFELDENIPNRKLVILKQLLEKDPKKRMTLSSFGKSKYFDDQTIVDFIVDLLRILVQPKSPVKDGFEDKSEGQPKDQHKDQPEDQPKEQPEDRREDDRKELQAIKDALMGRLDRLEDKMTKQVDDIDINSEDQQHNEDRRLSQIELQAIKDALMGRLDSLGDEMMKRFSNIDTKMEETYQISVQLHQHIPQWLAQLKNEQIPRLFTIFPRKKDWKRTETWFAAKVFTLHFACEHPERTHIVDVDGYEVIQAPRFIRKYGPWIKNGIRLLSGAIKVFSSGIIPAELFSTLANLLDLDDKGDLNHLLLQIAEGMDIFNAFLDDYDSFDSESTLTAVKEDPSSRLKFLTLDGINLLKDFIDLKETKVSIGGLVHSYHKPSSQFLWVCKEHRSGPEYDCERKHIMKNDQPELVDPLVNPPIDPPVNPPVNPLVNPSVDLLVDPPVGSPVSSLVDSPVGSLVDSPVGSLVDSPVDPLVDFRGLFHNAHSVLYDLTLNARTPEHRSKYTRIEKFVERGVERLKALEQRFELLDNVDIRTVLQSYTALVIHFCRFLVKIKFAVGFFRRAENALTEGIHFDELYNAGETFHSKFELLLKKGNPSDELQSVAFFVSKQTLEKHGWLPQDDLVKVYIPTKRIKNHECAAERKGKGKLALQVIKKRLDDDITVTELSLVRPGRHEELHILERIVRLYSQYNLNSCENILRFYGISIQDCRMCLVTDWASDGNLYNYMRAHDFYVDPVSDWKEKIRFSLEISEAVEYIHKKNLIHLDLRSDNIHLIVNPQDKIVRTKLSNFAQCRLIDDPETDFTYHHLDSIARRWWDPQRLQNYQYPYYYRNKCKKETDIFSLAILFWELAVRTGADPYPGHEDCDMYRVVCREGKRNEIPQLPKAANMFGKMIRKMWDKDQNSRPSIETVVGVLKELDAKFVEVNK